jgi:hypothetical protein
MAASSAAVNSSGAGERLADRRGRVAEMIDVLAWFDVVEELLVAHGVREMRQRFGDPQRLGGT